MFTVCLTFHCLVRFVVACLTFLLYWRICVRGVVALLLVLHTPVVRVGLVGLLLPLRANALLRYHFPFNARRRRFPHTHGTFSSPVCHGCLVVVVGVAFALLQRRCALCLPLALPCCCRNISALRSGAAHALYPQRFPFVDVPSCATPAAGCAARATLPRCYYPISPSSSYRIRALPANRMSRY